MLSDLYIVIRDDDDDDDDDDDYDYAVYRRAKAKLLRRFQRLHELLLWC